MKSERLEDVLRLVRARKAVIPESSTGLVSFISHEDISLHRTSELVQFFEYVEKSLNITLEVVGGGYGCTRITVRVIEAEVSSSEDLDKVMKMILESELLRSKAQVIGFDTLVTHDPYSRKNLKNGKTDDFNQDLPEPDKPNKEIPSVAESEALEGESEQVQFLYVNILEFFSIDEIRELCFLLSIDFDVLENGEKTSTVRSLILYCKRRRRLKKLISICKKTRPAVDWK